MSSDGMMVILCYVWMLFLSLISDVDSSQCENGVVGYPVGGYLQYPPFGDYPSNAYECWYVYYDGDPRHGDRVTMTFTTVSIEESSGCSNDVLEIRDHDSSGTLLARLCGDQACGHVTSTSGQFYLTFRSNHRIEKGGFFAKLRVTDPDEWQYSDTTWQGRECYHTYGTGGSSFSFVGLTVFIVIAVVITITVVVVCIYKRRRMSFGGGAVPMTRSGAPPPPTGYNPQPYATQIYTPSTPQSHPPSALQQYNPGAPQPQPSGAPQPYPSGTPQQYNPGAYPVQHYAPTAPNPPAPASADPSAPPTNYWNPADQGGPLAPATYNTEPPPSYEEVTATEKV